MRIRSETEGVRVAVVSSPPHRAPPPAFAGPLPQRGRKIALTFYITSAAFFAAAIRSSIPLP